VWNLNERARRAPVCSLCFLMRTFVRLRQMLATHEELRRKIDAMEKRYDARFQGRFRNDSAHTGNTVPAKKPIGFHAKLELTAKSAQTSGGKHKQHKTNAL
jgi:hypothetical protein